MPSGKWTKRTLTVWVKDDGDSPLFDVDVPCEVVTVAETALGPKSGMAAYIVAFMRADHPERKYQVRMVDGQGVHVSKEAAMAAIVATRHLAEQLIGRTELLDAVQPSLDNPSVN